MPALATSAYVSDLAGDHARSREVVDEMLKRMDVLGDFPDLPFVASGEVVDLLRRLGGRDRVDSILEQSRQSTPWLTAAQALAAGDFARAAELYRALSSPADVAVAELRAAEQLLKGGRSGEADRLVQSPLAFYRSVAATVLARRAERLLAASA
jgi:hypothetical protein